MMVPGSFVGDLRSPHCISDNLEVVQAENGILRLADSILNHGHHHDWSHWDSLRRKVASKTEGLVILSREVEELREELQQVKLNMGVLKN